MMRPPVLIEGPASLPVTIEELRRYCRVEAGDEDEDAHLERLAKSAVRQLDGYSGQLGRAIINQTWRQGIDAFPHPMEPKIRLKLPDVSKATIITFGPDSVEVPSPADRFVLHRDFIGWYVLPVTGGAWPRGVGIVEYVAGYGDSPDDVDDAVREAICMMVQHAYRLTGQDATLRQEVVEGGGSIGYFGPEIMRNALTAHVKDTLKHARWRPA